MAEVVKGVDVRTTSDVEVRIVQGGVPRRGLRRGAPSTSAATNDLKDALKAADFQVAAEIQLVPKQPGTRALRSDRSGSTEIEVQVSSTESALVLVEGAGGVYAWAYPREEAPRPTGRRQVGRRTLVFALAPTERGRRGATPSGRRGVVLDWIGDKLVEPVRAYILKFSVNLIVDVAVGFLEGDKPEGLISMAGDDVTAWRPGGTDLPALPQNRPAKILLMVHGTFSSTAGGFGHLLLSDSGRSFLARARANYDAILAFDHKTLEVDPQANATALMDALEKLNLPKDTRIDSIAHSRGGLVYRTFAEQVLAKRRPDIKLGKAIFVGCTNAGTHLAEPKNWASMIDLYTNAIMAGARAAVMLAGGGAISPLVSSGIKTVGRFVQMFSEVAITDTRVPGLAAMQPTSAAVKGLNDAQGGLDRLAAYYAVTSNFEARLQPRHGITKELVEFIVDRVTNRLFQIDNDLVVDTDSMITFGTRKERLDAGATLAFGSTDDVYHTIYFATDRLVTQLAEWLELPAASLQRPPLQARVEASGEDDEEKASNESLIPVRRGVRPLSTGGEALGRPTRRLGSGVGRDTSIGSAAGAGGGATPAKPAPSSDARRQVGAGIGRGTTIRPAAGAAGAAPPAKPAPSTVPCHFAAEMDPYPPLKKQVPLFVTISREKIEIIESAASTTTSEPVKTDTSRPIEVEVIARKNSRVVGESKVEVEVPDQKRPVALRFAIEGVNKGEADILVEARQGVRILVSFAVKPVFVEADSKPLRVTQTASAAAEGPEEPTVLRIYEIVEGGRVTLRFDLTCYDPNIAVSESRTLPSGFSRDAYVTAKFKDIEAAWLGTGRVYERFLRRLQDNGRVMAKDLLPDNVRTALWKHRDAIRAIQVVSEEPFIPWELLYVTDLKEGPDGKGFLSEWGLVRWLHNTRWPGRRLAMNKDRVRFVVPKYVDPDLKLEGAAEEVGMLKKIFGNPKAVQADSDAVADFLKADARNCDVLHFACHGEAAQGAVMNADLLMTGTAVDDNYVLDPLSADTVKTHTRFAEGASPIVFINACQTGRSGAGLAGVAGFVDAFLRPYTENGAGALVGALWSVDDKLAYVFAETFYKALQNGSTLVEATRAAREAAKGNKDDLTWLAYTVYGNPFARAI